MTKERVNISIDKELMQQARRDIPNLSSFIEECLKHYFGYANGTFPIGNTNDITQQIGKLQVELYLINQNYNAEESRERAANFEKDKTWRFLWNDYYRKLVPDKQLLSNAVEVLGIDSETLEDLLDEVYEVADKINVEEWETVYEWYQQEVE